MLKAQAIIANVSPLELEPGLEPLSVKRGKKDPVPVLQGGIDRYDRYCTARRLL